ncbi:MAG: hypothetical protein NC548_52645 [Lachnospiraceae bacterium]|nr:hypothetical protein [Lachnospiraceae bacterium]
MTVRRRPNDGTPGTPGVDSVRYWIRTSVSSVTMKDPDAGDATPVPEYVAVAVMKQSGNGTPVNINSMLSQEGLSLDYVFTRNGSVGGVNRFTSQFTIGLPTNTEFNNVIIRLYKGSEIIDSVTIPFVYDGTPGTPGVDSVSVNVSLDNVTFVKGTKKNVYVNVEVTKGNTKVLYGTGNTKFQISPESASSPVTVTSMSSTATGAFRFMLSYNGTDIVNDDFAFTVTYGDLVFNRIIHISTVENGGQGIPGPQGIQGCIYRMTQWQNGKEYRNDSELETDGLRYIDIVLIPNPTLATKAAGFMCKQTHKSSSDNAPGSTGASAYWTELNSFAPIFTPFLLADGAAITLLQSNQVIVLKEDGSTVNVALGGGSIPLWIGNSDPTKANFYVDDTGKAHLTEAEIIGRIIAGITDGQRVELQPDNKAMKIYDANGSEVCSFEGNSYTELSKLFSSQSGTFTIKNRTAVDLGFASGTSYGKGSASVMGGDTQSQSISKTVVLSNVVQSETPIEVSVSGYLATSYTVSQDYAETGPPTSTDTGLSDSTVIQPTKPVMAKHASASLTVRVDTYSDSTLKTKIASQNIVSIGSQSGRKDFVNAKAKTSVGGYHVLSLSIYLSASGSGMSASVSWGSATSGKSNISGSYVSDFYVSRYFANGFCLGMSATNYIWAYNQGTKGMRFVMENNGYGFDVSSEGIKTKHHSGNWMKMPLFVFKGKATYNSSGYSWSNTSSFDSKIPTLTRVDMGIIRITFPTSWSSLSLSLSNVVVNVVGYGTTHNGDNPIKAQIRTLSSTYMEVTISDDDSENDGAFLIDISII